jgi:unsaturated rhamnogalacturonyl hydrolase
MKPTIQRSVASSITRRSFLQVAGVSAAVASLPRLAGTSLAADVGKSPGGFSPEAIHQLMARVNEWQTAHPYRRPDHDCDWMRAAWYTGVTAAYRATGDKRFFDQALAWGRAKQFAVGYEKSGLNRLCPTDTWCELTLATGDKSMVEKVVAELNTPKPNTPTGARVWYLEGGRRYADSLFGLPVLAKLAKITGQRKYLAWMGSFFFDVAYEIWDAKEHFFYRDRRFIGKTTPNGKKVVWSRGSGWAYSGLARVLDVLPGDDLARPAYVKMFKQFSAYVAATQPADGLWRPNMADPLQFPMPETSGTGFFCFGLAWGVNNGLLDRPTYEPAARKAWAGLVANVSPEGKVLYGQDVGDRPAEMKREDSHEYVTGAFLLAASQMYKLEMAGQGTAAR